MKNLHKTLIFAFFLCLIAIASVILIQMHGESKIEKCSYLDPVIIDFLAFSAASFLIIEGFFKIFRNKNALLKKQLTRLIRIALGFSILILHIMQFMHK